MAHSLLNRQLATVTNILRERERDPPNQHAKVTPATCNEGSEEEAFITARAMHEVSARTTNASLSEEGMHTRQHALLSGKDAVDMNDPKQMLRELERDSQERRAKKKHPRSNDSTHTDMSKSVATTSQYGAVGDDPKKMLEELNRGCWTTKALGTGHSETSHLTGSEAILTEIKKEEQALGLDAYQGIEPGLGTAFEKSTTTHSPLHSLAPQDAVSTSEPMPASPAATTTCRHSEPPTADMLEPEVTRYVIALMLESAGCKWEEVVGWARYLFRSDTDELRAQQEREKQAQKKETFEAIVARYHVAQEKRRAVEKKPFANRVILTNLAADIDTKAIRQYFSKYQKDIRNITLLPERHPSKRTRTAYMDMSSRTAAVRASFEFGYIYGLKAERKLAVEE